MRLPELIYKLLDKVAPMNTKDSTELRQDAEAWFFEKIKAAKSKQTEGQELGFIDKILLVTETWWFRTLCAASFVPLVAYFQRLMTASEHDLDGLEDDHK